MIRVIKYSSLAKYLETIKPRYSHTQPLIDPNQIMSPKRGKAIIINSGKSKIHL